MLWASVMLRAIHMLKDIHMLRAMPLLKSTHMLIASNMWNIQYANGHENHTCDQCLELWHA